MKNLKRNSPFFLVVFVLTFGCQSPQKFKIKTYEKEELHVVEIDSRRIIQECYFMNAEKENNWRHQYSLNMLNDKNEVISAFFPTNQGKSECLAHLKKVEKILKNQSRVKLCLRAPLEKMNSDKSKPEIYDFGPLGKHESPYYALTFDTICNSNECFSISDTWTYTCPSFTETRIKN